MTFPIPADEFKRLRALEGYDVLDSPAEEAFDHITRAVAKSLNVPIALITLVDESRQWFKSCVGIEASETPREVAFCAHTIMNDNIMVVPDATRDVRFALNPLVLSYPRIRFYAGAPLRTGDGHRLGSLCAIDTVPRDLSADQLAMLSEMAKLVVCLLDLRLRASRGIADEKISRIEAEQLIVAKSSELIESNERFRDMAAHIPGVVYQFKIDGRGQWSFPYVSPAIHGLLGLDPLAVMRDPNTWFGVVHPEDLPGLEASIIESYRTLTPWIWEGRARNASGNTTWFRGTSTPKRLDDGSVLWNGLVLDQTDLRHTQEQLRQAQKMEAVGQLTGGVAHDFNNLLAIIQGNTEFIADALGPGNENVQAIQRATRRGSELTHHLLAFSRRQPLNPQQIDLKSLVSGAATLLARILGETIVLTRDIQSGCWRAIADPGQLENAIVNIAINARDAMPGGGELTISCANVTLAPHDIADVLDAEGGDPMAAGDYVVIAISDTGTGMSPEVMTHAFEPFFTTKEVGQGSGLGLSMVYGFARQSGGVATIESRLGEGTTVRIYLPRAVAPQSDAADAVEETLRLGDGEKVLIIEDDKDLRNLIVQMLNSLRYAALEAGDARGAEALLAAHSDIALILSDVVLPGGTSGPELIDRLPRTLADLPVVFMSGYPQSFIHHSELNRSGEPELLVKPFNKVRLAEALRKALGR